MGMTQKEIGLAMGYSEKSSQSMVSQIVARNKNPSPEKLVKMAETFDVHPFVMAYTEPLSQEEILILDRILKEWLLSENAQPFKDTLRKLVQKAIEIQSNRIKQGAGGGYSQPPNVTQYLVG